MHTIAQNILASRIYLLLELITHGKSKHNNSSWDAFRDCSARTRSDCHAENSSGWYGPSPVRSGPGLPWPPDLDLERGSQSGIFLVQRAMYKFRGSTRRYSYAIPRVCVVLDVSTVLEDLVGFQKIHSTVRVDVPNCSTRSVSVTRACGCKNVRGTDWRTADETVKAWSTHLSKWQSRYFEFIFINVNE